MQILIDVGATKLRVTRSVDGLTLDEPIVVSTPAAFDDAVATIAESIETLRAGGQVGTLVAGVPGLLDASRTQLVNAPNLPLWNGQPLRDRLRAIVHAPVWLENDTALVGLGEATVGAGRGSTILAYLTVSTGVNGVRIVDGAIDRSTMGFEVGHQIVDRGGTACPSCNQPGHLEGLIGGRALEREFGRPPGTISDPGVWATVARVLAVGVHNTLVYWSPDRVVIGGGMAKDIPFDVLQEELARISTIFPTLPPIVRATLGDRGGLLGGLAFLQQRE